MTIPLRFLAFLPLCWLAACNATMLGREAPLSPELDDSAWVLSDGAQAPSLDAGRWRLLAFFAPT